MLNFKSKTIALALLLGVFSALLFPALAQAEPYGSGDIASKRAAEQREALIKRAERIKKEKADAAKKAAETQVTKPTETQTEKPVEAQQPAEAPQPASTQPPSEPAPASMQPPVDAVQEKPAAQ